MNLVKLDKAIEAANIRGSIFIEEFVRICIDCIAQAQIYC